MAEHTKVCVFADDDRHSLPYLRPTRIRRAGCARRSDLQGLPSFPRKVGTQQATPLQARNSVFSLTRKEEGCHTCGF